MILVGVSWFEMEKRVARATIHDVAKAAGLSVSSVNRALHEPEKVRPETLQNILQAAESVRFYGIGSIRQGLDKAKPKIRIGILLLQPHRAFYKSLATVLEAAARTVRDHEVLLQIEFLEELSPQNVSAGLDRLAERADVIGLVAPEHPVVSATIERLTENGKKIFALVSQLSARCTIGYIGLDAWKVGRTAGWAFDNLCKREGKIGILVGNHRFRCQETNESGFRSYFREHASNFALLEPQSTFENANIAREVTEDILAKHADLIGLFISGGGISGATAALRDSGRGNDIVAVGYDLIDVTRTALLDGTLNFLISHPMTRLGEAAIAAMIQAFDGGAEFPPASISLPFDVHTSENL